MTTSPQPTILRETQEWIVIDKPAGWHSVAVRESDGAPTIQAWLAEQRPELAALPESGLVQRLDRWTSGCLLAGRTPIAVESLRSRLSDSTNAVRKSYLALVSPGLDDGGSWSLHFTSRHRGSAKVTVGRRGEQGSRGDCAWTVVRRAKADASRRVLSASAAPTAMTPRGARAPFLTNGDPPPAFDLLEVDLIGPGRRHQIRAGFAFLGHPLAGDGLYGGTPLQIEAGAPPQEEHPALHALRLELDGERVESPPPPWSVWTPDATETTR